MKNRIAFCRILTLLTALVILAVGTGFQVGANFEPVTSIKDIAWNSDGSLLALVFSNRRIEIVNGGLETIAINDFDYILSFAWNPAESNQFAVSVGQQHVWLGSVENDQIKLEQQITSQQLVVSKIAWSFDGTQLATVDEGDALASGPNAPYTVMVWNSDTGDLLSTYEDSYYLEDIAWNPQNRDQLLITGVTNYGGAKVVLWDTSDNAILTEYKEPNDPIISVAWNLDGDSFATMSERWLPTASEGTIALEIHHQTTIKSISTSLKFIGNIVWNPSQYLAVSSENMIQIWDVELEELVNNFETDSLIITIDWSPNGSTLAYGQANGKAGLISLP